MVGKKNVQDLIFFLVITNQGIEFLPGDNLLFFRVNSILGVNIIYNRCLK